MMVSCDYCNSGNQVEWCKSCNRFMCKNCAITKFIPSVYHNFTEFQNTEEFLGYTRLGKINISKSLISGIR